MNRDQHLIIGIVAFVGYTFLIYSIVKIASNTIIFGFIAVAIGSVIPDLIEPARSWMHRGLGHSKRALKFTAGGFAITAVVSLFSIIAQTFSIFYIISGFFLGYAVHLLADSTTEVGLPD